LKGEDAKVAAKRIETRKGETQMKRINQISAKLTSTVPKVAPLAILFTCFMLGSGNLFATQRCYGGSEVLSGGTWVGCAYNTWGPEQIYQCTGTTIFSGPNPKSCHICIESIFSAVSQQIRNDDFTGLTLTPIVDTSGVPSRPSDFKCLQCTPPPDGLTAWWTLDEPSGNPVQDFTHNLSYDGVRHGATTVPGHDAALGAYVGNANHFNGLNEYIDVPAANTQLDVGPGAADGSGDFSIDAWVKIDPNTNSNGVRVIAEKRTFSLPNHYKGYSFYLYKPSGWPASQSGYLGLQLADEGAAPGYANYGVPSLWVPADGQWHFVAVSVSREPGAFNVQFFLDKGNPTLSVLGVPSPIRSGSLTNTSPLRIGMGTINNGSDAFNGSIDEVEFFNRAVPLKSPPGSLLQGDFQSIYDAKCYGKCKSSSNY
jgi:hypothetical protein